LKKDRNLKTKLEKLLVLSINVEGVCSSQFFSRRGGREDVELWGWSHESLLNVDTLSERTGKQTDIAWKESDKKLSVRGRVRTSQESSGLISIWY